MPEMADAKLQEVRAIAEQLARTRKWDIGETLGSGGSAAVFKIRVNTQDYALKIYDPRFFDEINGAAEKQRIQLQEQLIGHSCPSLVQLLEIGFEFGTCYILMELARGTELSKCLKIVPREALWPLLEQLVVAAQFLESKALVHRDIKPHNIMVSDDFTSLKLIDLGVVRDSSKNDDQVEGTDHGRRRPFIATAQYSSPEYLFRLIEPSEVLWKGLTFYQIGAVLHDLIVRRPLFADEVEMDNKYAVAMAVLKKIPLLETADPVDSDLKALAAYCLTKDLRRRLDLVNWDDFQRRGKDPAKELARRIQQLNGSRLGPATLENERHRRDLARKECLERLLTQLSVEFKDALPGMYCERIRVDKYSNAGLMRFQIDQMKFALDISLEAKWDDEDAGAATVYSTAVIGNDATNAEFTEGREAVTTLNLDGTNFDVSVAAVKDAFFSLIKSALDLYEKSGSPSNSLIIPT